MKEWTWFSKKMFFFDSIYMTGTIASIYRTFIISDWFCFIYLIFKLFDSRRQISAGGWSQFSDLDLDIFLLFQNLKFKWFATQSFKDFISTPLGEFRRRCRVTRWCSISDSDSELVELELEDDDELEEELELDMSKYLQKYHFRSDFPNEDSVVKWTALQGCEEDLELNERKSTWAYVNGLNVRNLMFWRITSVFWAFI